MCVCILFNGKGLTRIEKPKSLLAILGYGNLASPEAQLTSKGCTLQHLPLP